MTLLRLMWCLADLRWTPPTTKNLEWCEAQWERSVFFIGGQYGECNWLWAKAYLVCSIFECSRCHSHQPEWSPKRVICESHQCMIWSLGVGSAPRNNRFVLKVLRPQMHPCYSLPHCQEWQTVLWKFLLEWHLARIITSHFPQGCSVFWIVIQPIFTSGVAWMSRQSQHESSKALKIYPFSWYIQFLRVALGSKNPCWPARLSEARVQDQKLERISYIGLLLALWLDLFCKAVVDLIFGSLNTWHFFANIILLELSHVYGICNFTLPNPSRTMPYQFTLQMEKF